MVENLQVLLKRFRLRFKGPEDNSFLKIIEEEFLLGLSHNLVASVERLGSFFQPNHQYQRDVVLALFRLCSVSFKDFDYSDIITTLFHQDTQSINNQLAAFKYEPVLIYIYNQTPPQSCYYNMSQIQILKSAFEPKIIKDLLKKIDYVSYDQSPQKIIQDIEVLSPPQYLWAIAKNPAYFVQYQIKSAAILRVRGLALIVWKPKYIEYPSIVKFPALLSKKPNNLKIQIATTSTTTPETNKLLAQFIQNFYGTFFYSDQQFQTNLVTYSKHFITKLTKHCYWHTIIDDSDSLAVSNMDKMDNVCRVRITGMKEGYNKTLLLFSFKGERGGFFGSAKAKWMQLVSFLAMLVIFYSIVACSSDSQEGICTYRQQLTLGGAGVMLALIGFRYGKDKKKKKLPGAAVPQNTQKQD